jgi:glycine C-acetyltransferase/8-amino-7-oxononanoate synthase
MDDLFSKFDPLIEQRETLLSTGLTDPFNLVMERVESPTVAICNGRRTILLGTYNYMGMTFDPDVVAAGKQALDEFGSGTTGSRVLNGTYQGHEECEAALRDFYAMDHAMVFSTGYQANLGIISTVAGKDDYIILDIDSHASIYDGCALGNAQIVPFRHNDLDALEKRLRRLPPEAGKLVVLEGVYSMLGDVAPLDQMVPLAKSHGAMVLVDEAHSMGFIGENGRGVAEAQGVIDQVDFIIGTFSKSVGTVGGFCVSNHPKFEILRLVCRPYVFTASLPPSVVATAATSIRKLMHGRAKRDHLWENSKRLHVGLKALGFTLGTDEPQSAIIAVIMPDLETGAAMWEALLHEGLYVNLARPPATPANMTLLRCSLCAEHSEEQVGEILTMFEAAGRATGCIN